MSAVRVFLSFDLEHDRDLCAALLEQARRGNSFSVAGRSEGGAIDDSWTERARERITASDEVVVICGEHTDAAKRVSAELRIAQEQKKPYVLLWGRREQMCKKPSSARVDDGMYHWTAEILDQQILSVLRRSRQSQVPEGMRRVTPRS